MGNAEPVLIQKRHSPRWHRDRPMCPRMGGVSREAAAAGVTVAMVKHLLHHPAAASRAAVCKAVNDSPVVAASIAVTIASV